MANYGQAPQAGYPAPNQGYPAPNQGYPVPNQGYPAPNQGYPAPNQGYQAPNQGYQAPNQGYQAPNQGYPPTQQGAPAGQAGGSVPAYSGEMPSEDVLDDPNLKAPNAPSAPPPELPQNLPGYGNIGFEEAFIPPPAYEAVAREPPQRHAIQGSAALTSEDAKAALLEFVGSNCCYGKGPAEEMTLTDIQSTSAFHYNLESYCEGRTSKWRHEPCSGHMVVNTGPPPGPWEISVPGPEMFKKSEMRVEVPNTSNVKMCHDCFGAGYKRCYRCHGRGKVRCNFCNGSGRQSNASGEWTQCMSCSGHGRKRCFTCDGYGQNQCHICKGLRNIRWFIEVTIKWKIHDSDHVVERTALPDELIKGVQGTTAFNETAPRVWPINHFPDQEINNASKNLVDRHSTQFPTERILQQRHNVRIVPVANVSYSFKERIGAFFVYGLENKVYFPDYPAKCCCGCSIL